MDTFKDYSQYYDLIYKDKEYESEIDYVTDLIKTHHPETKKILELGCGTGIHASLLVKKKYEVHGIDISDTMLQLAEKRKKALPESLQEKIKLHKNDIRNFSLFEKFDTSISLFHVMSYLPDINALKEVLKKVNEHLNENGLFIFDCWHGPAVINEKPELRTRFFENEKLKIKRISTPEFLPEKNTVNVFFDIEITDVSENKTVNIQEKHPMRYWFKEEIELALSQTGFKLLINEEWLSKKPLSNTGWNACYVCKKI